MKKSDSILRIINCLKESREEYAIMQINMEKGLKGFLYRLGFLKIKSQKKIDYFNKTQKYYYDCLLAYRKFIVSEIKKKRKNLNAKDAELIAQMTVFNEVKKLRKEKELKNKNRGLVGFLSTQRQEWRELPANFKIGFSVFFFLISIALLFLLPKEYNLIKTMLIVWGIIIFLEGAMQIFSNIKANKLGLNRFDLYQGLSNKLKQAETNDFIKTITKLHKELEASIWEIRVFEKRVEFKRYFWSIILGLGLAYFIVLPFGKMLVIKWLLIGLVTRFIWFFLPFENIKESFSRKNDESLYFEDLSVGEATINKRRVQEVLKKNEIFKRKLNPLFIIYYLALGESESGLKNLADNSKF